MLYIIDANKDETIVHRVNYEMGKYLASFKLKGFWTDQSNELIKRMYSDKCNKVIFNEFGFGQGLANVFEKIVRSKEYDHTKFTIITDSKGSVIFYN